MLRRRHCSPGRARLPAANAMLGGVGAALLLTHLDATVGAAIAVGVPVAAVLFGLHVVYEQRRLGRLDRQGSVSG